MRAKRNVAQKMMQNPKVIRHIHKQTERKISPRSLYASIFLIHLRETN